MNPEEMKATWQHLNQRLEQQESFSRRLIRDGQMGRARDGLRPLFWGQAVQIVFGIALVVLGVSCWVENYSIWHRLIAGLVIHVYGVLAITLASVTVFKIKGIDYAAPVATIQKQLTGLRCFYVRCGLFAGMAWWLLWIPFFVVLGLDFVVVPPAFFWSTGVGVAGLLGCWAFHRWARHPSRPQLAKWWDDGLTGGSLVKAKQALEEVKRFDEPSS